MQNFLEKGFCIRQIAFMDARAVIDAFGYASLARAIDCPEGTVSAWRARNSIPQCYWRAIEREARRRRMRSVTYRALEAAAPPHRRRKILTLEARP